MDVDGQMGSDSGSAPADGSLSGIESKKHRMNTGQDSEGFARRYELLEQLGSGASGTVWKCRLAAGQPGGGVGNGDEPEQGVVYAAKIIDLRPFKLRERFSMQRLMREVEIMRRLRHPNIIRLVEALDTPEQLVLVLEYAPGVELFDAILSKSSFSEDEARPVFIQVARALRYMHSMQIVHRDIKPENVMIMDRSAPDGLYPEAKLLDFGLSKAIDPDWGGSAARTFVGTPSYLAPEVENSHGGKGKPYGTPVDCWSLGAMLYVMLVARFPEFQVQGQQKYLRMVGPLWDKVSPEAKELIRSLMAFDPGARLTVVQALRHRWLKEFAEQQAPPSPLQQPRPTPLEDGLSPLPNNAGFPIPTVPTSTTSAEAFGGGGTQAVARGEGTGGDARRAGQGFDSPRRRRYHQRGSRSRPPIVTEQETPPSASSKKAFEFGSRIGPNIRELQSDESPVSSLDSGMGDLVTANRNDSGLNSGATAADSGAAEGEQSVIGGRGGEKSDGGITSTGNSTRKDHETAMVAVYGTDIGLVGRPGGDVPLLQLQNRITTCLETAVTTYSESPEAAASLRRSAMLCRESLRDSVTLLRKIERTAAQVITLFPDLTLAVEEGVPELAHDFFSTVKSWVHEMYTAVSIVQAKNNANAEKVGEAMKSHAEMGLRRRQQERQRREQERTGARAEAIVGPGSGASGRGGSSMFVARRRESIGLTGDMEVDAGRQGNMISVDPETFELVRKIQAMKRAKGSGAGGGREVQGEGEGVTSSANADGVDPVESISDERLLNLFLLMGKTDNMEDGERTQTSTASEGVPQGEDARGAVDGKGANTEGMSLGGSPREFQDGVDAILAVAAAAGGASGSGSGSDSGLEEAHVVGKRKTRDVRDPSGGSVPASAASGAAHVVGRDGALAATMAAQMSIDEGAGIAEVEVEVEEEAEANGLGNPSGGEGGEGEMQLARRDDDDKVFMEVQRALQMLHEVDSVLEQLALFWANSEVIFDVLLRKGDLVEKFVAFSNKPRLLQRFKERLVDYKRFWEGVQGVCNKYVCGRVNCGGSHPGEAGVSFPGTAGIGPAFDLPQRHQHREEFSMDGRKRSPSAASNQRNNSEPLTGSGGVPEGLGVGRESGDFSSRRESLAGEAGGWANVDMGMPGTDGRH